MTTTTHTPWNATVQFNDGGVISKQRFRILAPTVMRAADLAEQELLAQRAHADVIDIDVEAPEPPKFRSTPPTTGETQ